MYGEAGTDAATTALSNQQVLNVTFAAALEFGRFRVLLRRRGLLADGLPVELGTRAFDLLVILLEADGALVTKEELFRRVWPGIVVSEGNLKVQISALRKRTGPGPQSHPYGIWARLPLHWHIALECHRTCLPRP